MCSHHSSAGRGKPAVHQVTQSKEKFSFSLFPADIWDGMNTSLCKRAWDLVFSLCKAEIFHEVQAENIYSALAQLDIVQLVV